ncbi:helix-turn-helix domain-containing protein [Pandoraea cepalis]|nr:helix-turn-helix transcriptional regulator [Pandoraea cepalis]
MESIGERLRAERKRLGLSLKAFGALGGVSEKTMVLYEKGERTPDAGFVACLARHGVDALFVVTGKADSASLTADEADLVRRYRGAPDAVKAAALAALAAGAAPSSSKFQMNFSGATIGSQSMVDGDVKVKSRKVVGVEKKK